MKGSGKQILMSVLKELSTRRIPDSKLEKATDRIRAALLWHGSTSEDNFRLARYLQWANAVVDGEVERQGLATNGGSVLLCDFLETMYEMPGLENFMRSSYKGLSKKDYEAALWGLWCLVSATQMFSYYLNVEAKNDAELELEKWIANMIGKYKLFVAEDKE
jgi:hypothetical protein